MNRLLLTILLVLKVAFSFAQSHGRITTYTVKDGLEAYAADWAIQDKYGFIWFSQLNSMARFDGYTFKNYAHQPDDSLMQLGPQIIGRLHKDERGELWVNNMHRPGLNGSLLKYDYSKDAFIKFTPPLKGFLRSLAVENDSIIWLGTHGEGLYRFNLTSGSLEEYQNPFRMKNVKFSADYIFNIHFHTNYLFLFTGQGIWKFDITNKKFLRPTLNPVDTTLLHNDAIFQADFRKDGVFQLGIRYALVLDDSCNIIKKYNLPDPYIKSAVFNYFDLDNNENLWYVTEQGLNVYDTKKKVNSLITEGFGWTNTTMIDRDNNIWMFGWDLGVKKFARSEIQYVETRINDNRDLYPALTGTIGKGNKEFSILVGGVQAFQSDLFTSNINDSIIKVKAHHVLPQNGLGTNFSRVSLGSKYVWIGSWAGGIYGFPYDYETGTMQTNQPLTFIQQPDNPYTLPSNAATVAVEDTSNNILWAGTDKGLSKIDLSITYGLEGSVLRFAHNPVDSNSISSNIVNDLLIEDDGSLWVGTDSGVDFVFNGKLIHITKGQGVASFQRLKSGELLALGRKLLSVAKNGKVSQKLDYDVGKLVEDKNENLWLLNSKGLSRYDPINKVHVDFLSEFGHVTGMVISTRGIIQLTKNPDLLITFDPSAFQVSTIKVIPQLTNLLVNNLPVRINHGSPAPNNHYLISESILKSNELTLDYLHNNFTLEFSAMQMTAPEKNLYRHKLEGYDKDWIETNYKNRTATYTNLPSGTYTFRVKASNHHGVWSDNERTLKVIILPPPWRTWWAYAGYSLFVVGLLVWARRNIVQRERLKSSLALAKVEQEKEHFELEKAKEVDKIKTSFFTNISHEFRTPLTLIMGPVQDLMEKYTSDPKTQEKLKLVQRNSDLLLKLINQLLDLAKLESGSLKVEKSQGDVFSFVRAIASSFESVARQKNVSLQVNVPEGSCSALFDKDKVETILINLINNAVKFTGSGGLVKVFVSVDPSLNTTSDQQPATSSLTLTVSDTGIGIPIDQQQKIFERFHQVSEAHKEVGTGIGLALVKELVTLMRGEIGVTSEVGVGSEFVVTVPIELVASDQLPVTSHQLPVTSHQSPVASDQPPVTSNQQPVTSQNLQEDGQAAKPHILVVEDNPDLRAFIIDSLGDAFHFLEAENGKQGLAVALQEVPDLIISDIMMPEMDGLELTLQIRKEPATRHIPIILLTAKASENARLSGLKSGADDYLIKPFNRDELLLKVHNTIQRQVKLRERLRADLMTTPPTLEVCSEEERFLHQVKEKILQRLSDEQLGVESLAEEIGMTRGQLYRKVSALTGISVNALIRKLRLQRAAQLLEQNWGPVSQVAYEVGFSSLSYFSKVFKEEFGRLPSGLPKKST